MFNSIDWESQWAIHSPGYRDGYLHLKIKEHTLKLKPGPGFGDLSHPTTNLVLKLMEPLILGKHVLDIGCGSGILSLAAVAIGAASVSGVDIEADAIEHSRVNAKLNGMESKARFSLPREFVIQNTPLVVLMNMIQSEQCIAWESLKQIHNSVSIAIISGILKKDRNAYLKLSKQWGWKLIKQASKGEWAGFVFYKEIGETSK